MFESAFYLLTICLLAALGVGLRRNFAPLLPLWLGAGLWLGYITALARFGVFRELSLPPRIPLLLVIPALAFIFWFYKTGRHRPFLDAVPRWQPVAFQSFRIAVELLIVGMYIRQLGPVEPTMEGYNFDIVTGVTAPLVALAVYRWKFFPEKLVWWWNIMGLLWLANVVFIFVSLMVAPGLWGYAETPIRPDFGQMPYLLIPAVYMPVAVFVHVFSMMQLRRPKP